jgi:isopenicillin N synthase-like dioxygenase
MIYHARTKEENLRCQNIYSRAHTDYGTLTLLFRQPIAALQILDPEGSWKWVDQPPGSITVNIGDALQFWTNGYFKPVVHRVVAPPDHQTHLDRVGVLYFVRSVEIRSRPTPALSFHC